MSILYRTLQIIADILSFNSDLKSLEQQLKDPDMDWNYLVTVSSQHLVMTTVYCRLQEKNLLNLLPEELKSYLEEITIINRNRNKTILKEIHEISRVLTDNQIEHVFLKGCALLAANYYKDFGERMIGDIDILVAPDQLQTGNDLLINEGYEPMPMFSLSEHKHLPRLIKKTALMAVELHRKVLSKPYLAYLKPMELLKEKEILNGIPFLKPKHLLEHNILNLQRNDLANNYKFINFRAAYDALIILKENPEIDIKKMCENPCFESYFLMHSIFLNDFPVHPKSLRSKIGLWFFKFKMNHLLFQKIWNKFLFIVRYFSFLLNRLWALISNKNYRRHIIKNRLFPN